MRRILAALLLALLLPACASALQIDVTADTRTSETSRLIVFSALADESGAVPGQESEPDAAMLAIDAQIEARFSQQKAKLAAARGTVVQTGGVWQDGRTASMALLWKGEQPGGSDGCTGLGLTVDLQTGEEIQLSQLFADWDGALTEMEAIITDDVLDGMSDYMEYADLLPVPTEQYSFDDVGITVYWPEDRYRYYDGTSGSVTFYWHELADYIGEDSPVSALARPDAANDAQAIESLCTAGMVTQYQTPELGELLGSIGQRYQLADPDYTTDALVYPLERMRGFAVEIPKYAETPEEETPVSAVRAARVSLGGQLTTGKTTRGEITALLGEPEMTRSLDEDAAQDALLEPGESLYYAVSGRALQLHLDEEGVLACVILREAMPEGLY
ncbi:MAG: hypothetical protein ACI4PG_10695 [Candidatus Ventricola sp.]